MYTAHRLATAVSFAEAGPGKLDYVNGTGVLWRVAGVGGTVPYNNPVVQGGVRSFAEAGLEDINYLGQSGQLWRADAGPNVTYAYTPLALPAPGVTVASFAEAGPGVTDYLTSTGVLERVTRVGGASPFSSAQLATGVQKFAEAGLGDVDYLSSGQLSRLTEGAWVGGAPSFSTTPLAAGVAVADFVEDGFGGAWYLTGQQVWQVDTAGASPSLLGSGIVTISEVLGPGGCTLQARHPDGSFDSFTAP
jgi:hypothetical protein